MLHVIQPASLPVYRFRELDIPRARNRLTYLSIKPFPRHMPYTLAPIAQNANTSPNPPNMLAVSPTASSFVGVPRVGSLPGEQRVSHSQRLSVCRISYVVK